MKIIKVVVILMLVYVGIVVTFESLIGYFQPADQSTLIITTTDDGGVSHDRVLSRLDSEGQLFVATNHWPRAWYKQALDNPNVGVVLFDSDKLPHLAVPASDEEHDRVNREHSLPLAIKFLTGFPPRYFFRLEPRKQGS
ncbi:MAG: hypothetical protein ACI9CE_001638 [Flavobacterium sp.]|jgi:hypothetical protein